MEIAESRLQVFSIFFPPEVVHSGSRPLIQASVASPQPIHIHVVQQGGEPHLSVTLRGLPHTVPPAVPVFPALRPERVRLGGATPHPRACWCCLTPA